MSASAATPAAPPKPRRRWFQFSLRSLLIAVTLIAVLLAWFIVPRMRRHAVMVRLESREATIVYADAPTDESWLTRRLRDYLPQDWFDDVVFIDTQYSDLVDFESLTQLAYLHLRSSLDPDAGLAHLAGLTALEDLSLGGTKITDSGLVHLKRLTQLQRLDLYGTQVTDAALEHLKALTQLKELDLGTIELTEARAADIHTALPSCQIEYGILNAGRPSYWSY